MKGFATIALSALGFMASAATAQALNARTWVSSTGVDQAGCGPIASPCRTLQYAHDATTAGGEIDVKDSGGYGSLVITKSISVVGDGSLAGVLAPSGGNAIEINAGTSDIVILRGLTIEGAGVGINGIVLNSGRKLDVSDCFITRFAGSFEKGNGILIQPASGSFIVTVSKTTSSYNGYGGINYYPPTGSTASLSIMIDGVTATNNGWSGIALFADKSTGSVTASLWNTLTAKSNTGILLVGDRLDAHVDNSHANQNASHGFSIAGAAEVAIGRSSAANNGGYGISGGSNVVSYKDNRLYKNTSGATLLVGTATLN